MVINQYGFGDLVLVLTPSCDYCGLFDPKCAIFNRRICAIFTRCLQKNCQAAPVFIRSRAVKDLAQNIPR